VGDASAPRRPHAVRVQYQSVNARFWHPEIQEVNRDGPSRPIIIAEAIKRKCDIPFQTRSRARDKKKNLAHVHVFGSNAANEPVLARNSFVRGIPLSGSSGLKVPGTCVQYPGLQGGGALGDASTPGTPAGSIAANAHGGTYSHVAVAGGA